MDERVNVLVVDDDYYAREAMRMLLSKDTRTRVWGVASSTAEALGLLSNQRAESAPDVLLLDIRLAEGDRAGILAIPLLKSLAPDARVLMTSVYHDEDTVLSAIQAGADGYVWKNESTDGIAGAIVKVSEGRFVVTPSVAEKIQDRMTGLHTYATDVMTNRGRYEDLTASIRKTMDLYCTWGLSAKEISEELELSVNTVNSRIKAAYIALGASNRRQAFQQLVERYRDEDASD